jgi:hypothetical protein
MHSSGVAANIVANGYGGGVFGVYMSDTRGRRCVSDNADAGVRFTAAN